MAQREQGSALSCGPGTGGSRDGVKAEVGWVPLQPHLEGRTEARGLGVASFGPCEISGDSFPQVVIVMWSSRQKHSLRMR